MARSLHTLYWIKCGRKIIYAEPSEAFANAEALTRRSRLGEVLRAYPCPFQPIGEGEHFHIGHAPGTKPPLRLRRRTARGR